MATCLIYDERRGYRHQLVSLVAATSVQRVESVPTTPELLAHYDRHGADVVLIGSQRALRTATDATHQLLAAHPRAAVIVIGARDDQDTLRSALADGARGFLLWDDILAAPESAHRPQAQVLVAVMAACITTLAPTRAPSTPHPTPPEAQGPVALTDREFQVLTGMSRGRSNHQIGSELCLGVDTVKAHARRLFRKLVVADRAHAVARGFRLGLLP